MKCYLCENEIAERDNIVTLNLANVPIAVVHGNCAIDRDLWKKKIQAKMVDFAGMLSKISLDVKLQDSGQPRQDR